ncbi:MAG: 2-oxo acid dehydrogenase subunit E2, partial [Thermoprotei archaeon]
GSIGGLFATPIINYPESAILGVYRIHSTPTVDGEGKLVKREVMNISLTFDHRIADGAVAALFANRVKELLEDPSTLLQHMF